MSIQDWRSRRAAPLLAINLCFLFLLQAGCSGSGSNSAAPVSTNPSPTPQSPQTPTTSTTPDVPSTPQTPATPETPATPVTPEVPGTPQTPTTPETPETPVTPEVPSTPQTPTTPETPETPTTPDLPETPDDPSPPLSSVSAPVLLFTDALSGPLHGGENDAGAYLSIFGKNFGSDLSAVKVRIGGAEVANYRVLDQATGYARTGIQRLIVQVGALGSPVLGVALPISVCVNSDCSTNDPAITFTPNAGRIFFVAKTGSDSAAVIGDIAKPFRTLQDRSPNNDCSAPNTETGVYSKLKAGDHVVIRAGEWNDIGRSRAWLRFCASNSAIGNGASVASAGGRNGTEGNWIHITAYPGEVVRYTTPSGMSAAFQGAESAAAGYTGMYISISNLKIQVDKNALNDAAPMNEQYGTGPWRIVNNELGPWPSVVDARAAGYSGKGQGTQVFGNYVHDIRRICDGSNAADTTLMAQCPGNHPVIVNGETLLNHGFYLDAGGGDMEVAYNWVANILEGNLVQTFASHSGGNLTGLLIHNNWLENSGKYGLNISDGTRSARIWNNVVIGANLAGLRVNIGHDSGIDMVIFNNTFYNNSRHDSCQSATTWNSSLTGTNTLLITNNLFVAGPQTRSLAALYCGESGDSYVHFGTNMVWAPANANSIDVSTPHAATTLVQDPQFTDAANANFTLKSQSPAVGKGVAIAGFPSFADYPALRLRGSNIDLGAYQTHAD